MQFSTHNFSQIIFNFYEISTFFVLGNKQDDPQDSDNNSAPEDDENEIILEKFFISHDNDLSSQSLAYLELGRTTK